MARRGQASTAILASMALCLAVLGGWIVYVERADTTFELGLSSLGSDDAGGLWTRTPQSVLQNCERVLLGKNALATLYLPVETREALAPHCFRTAKSATTKLPTDAYAWSISALAAADLEDWPVMNDALVRSQLTGPAEAWIANLRVTVAQHNFARLDDPARLVAEQDLRLLLVSTTGIRTLAQRYVGDIEFRQRVETQVQTMPPEIQQRFVSEVRRQMS